MWGPFPSTSSLLGVQFAELAVDTTLGGPGGASPRLPATLWSLQTKAAVATAENRCCSRGKDLTYHFPRPICQNKTWGKHKINRPQLIVLIPKGQ